MITGIIGAMDSEVNSLVKAMGDAKKTSIGNLSFYEGTLEAQKVVIVKCGIGKVNAAICTTVLINTFKVNQVINTGIAGAMEHGLRIFDFVVSTAAIHHDLDVQFFGYKLGEVPGAGTVSFPADKDLILKTENAFSKTAKLKERKLVKGLIASGDQFISGSEKKNFIKSNFNPACCEMEGASIAHTCFNFGIPFVIIRCMSDMADESATETYSFNEDVAAEECANFILSVLKEIKNAENESRN